MTLIVGTIEDSAGHGLTGILRVTLDAMMVNSDPTPDAVLLTQSYEFAIAAGVVNVNLDQSEVEGVTYRFEFLSTTETTTFYFADGTIYSGPTHYYTDNQWYTGAAHNTDSQLVYPQTETRSLSLLDFHAIVPNLAQVEFSALLPTGVSRDLLDTSLRRLAEILISNVDYVEALRGGPRFLGNYSSTTYYKLNDCVSYGGESWLWINANPGTNSTPSTTNANWQKIAGRGDPGGISGQDTPYDATGWAGAIWAPAANAVRDKFELMAPLESPAFTGTPTVPSQLLSDETDAAASTLYVAEKIADELAAATFATRPNATSDTTPATTGFVKNVYHRYSRLIEQQSTGIDAGASVAGYQDRLLNTIASNSGDVISLSAGVFLLKAGTYRIAAIAPAINAGVHRLALYDVDNSIFLIDGINNFIGSSVGTGGLASLQGLFELTANTQLSLRHWVSSSWGNGLGGATSDGISDGRPEIYAVVELWRVD